MIEASAATIRQLKGVPALIKVAGFALLRAKTGQLTITLPDGRALFFNRDEVGPRAHLNIKDLDMIKRVAARGDIGFAESYADGQWTTDDLTAILAYFASNYEEAGRFAMGGAIAKLTNRLRHFFNRNTRDGARRNIVAHYDLGNDFYGKWLDESMTYSSALFESDNSSMEQGQQAKYAAICDTLGLGPSSHVLEIGCGWGGFAEHAARHRGSKVTCLTISDAQHAYAVERMSRAGLSDQVEIRLEDYRDHKGVYDGVASIEMFEAVGERYWPAYFSKIENVLKPNATAALQVITIGDEHYSTYRKRADFIQHYIFPGGMLPSEKVFRDQADRAGLRYDGVRYFGQDYARTLREWRRRFLEAWDDIQAMDFDISFKRIWEFYLSYCEAGFQTGRINVGQFALSKT